MRHARLFSSGMFVLCVTLCLVSGCLNPMATAPLLCLVEDDDSNYRIGSVAGITDMRLVAEIAVEDDSPEVRDFAVGRLTDIGAVARLAIEDNDEAVRCTAVLRLRELRPSIRRVKDKNVLAMASGVLEVTDVASVKKRRSRLEPFIRDQILAFDQNCIERFMADNYDAEIRRAAVLGVTNQVQLAKIAAGDGDAKVRSGAVLVTKDRALLSRLALNDHDALVRRSAVLGLEDEGLLVKIATEDNDGDVRHAAVRQISAAPWQKILDAMSTMSSHEKGAQEQWDRAVADRTTLLKRLCPIYAKIALNDKDAKVRCAAVKRLWDQDALTYIVERDADRKVRRNAIRRLDWVRRQCQQGGRGPHDSSA